MASDPGLDATGNASTKPITKAAIVEKKVLVTGGAGFIGVNFLRLSVPRYPSYHFVNADALTYAANPASLSAVATADNYTFRRVDIADADATRDLFREFEPDLVVHFAAESHVDRSILGPAEFVRTNVQGTFNLLESAREVAAKKPILFHHVSTDEVYGSLGPSGAFTETTRYDPSSPYSATKAASDHLVRAYYRTFGLPIRVSNCSNNYGPFQFPEKLIPLMILNATKNERLPVYGDGSNVRDWLYVEDHCEAIWTIVERGADGETYNIGGNSEARNLDLVRALCRIVAQHTGQPEQRLLELITFVKDRPGHDQRYAMDASKLRRECGWKPSHSLETGLELTVKWYLEHPDWIEQVTSGAYRSWIDENYGAR